MRCPLCKSTNIKEVSIFDFFAEIGDSRCEDCFYQSHWLNFVDGLNKTQPKGKSKYIDVREYKDGD